MSKSKADDLRETLLSLRYLRKDWRSRADPEYRQGLIDEQLAIIERAKARIAEIESWEYSAEKEIKRLHKRIRNVENQIVFEENEALRELMRLKRKLAELDS